MVATRDLADLRSSDFFDSRDVIARIDELEQIGLLGAATPGESYGEIAERDAADYLHDEDAAELKVLREFAEEASAYVSDWQYGATFIRDSYFEDYARELAEEIGAIDPDASWPLSYIDWERAADALKMDYTSFELDGVTFWARS